MAISIPSFDCFLFGVGLYVYNTVLTLDIVNDGPSVKTQPYRSAPTPGKGPAAAPLRAAVSPPSFVSLYVIFVAAPYSSTLHHFAIVHFFLCFMDRGLFGPVFDKRGTKVIRTQQKKIPFLI